MATHTLRCPKCEAQLRLANRPPDGKKIKCPKCAALFAPAATEEVVPSTAVKAKPTPPALPPTPQSRPKRPADETETPRRKPRVVVEEVIEELPRRPRAKRDLDDEVEDDDRPRRPRKKKNQKSNLGLIIGIGAGAAALLLLLGIVVIAAIFLWPSPPAQVAQKDHPAPVVNPVPVLNPAPVQKGGPKPNPRPNPRPMPVENPEGGPALAPLAPGQIDEALLTKTKRATALIQVALGKQSASGSGFLVKSSGDTAYIITNYHVIALEQEKPQQQQPKGPKGLPGGRAFMTGPGPFGRPGPKGPKGFGPKGGTSQPQQQARPKVTVVLYSGTPEEQSVPAEVVAVDDSADLAALRITGARNLPEAIDVSQEAAVAETQPVFVLGFPVKAQAKPNLTVGLGTIAGLRRDANNDLIDIHINGDILPGNSGGPVIDPRGHLVGVAVAHVPGKQIGFIVPADELKQLFKGRIFASLVFQLKQQKQHLDMTGEVWFFDRNSGVRGREAMSQQLPAEGGKLEIPADLYLVYARLADPMLKIKAAHLFVAQTDQIANKPGPDGWAQLPNSTQTEIKIQDQSAFGTFKLPPGAHPDQSFAFQFSFVNADGRTVFTEPHPLRLTFPKNFDSATLNVTAIADVPTRRYIEDQAPKLFPGQVKVKSKTDTSLVLEVSQVGDPKALVPQITFGQVTSVQGHTIEVTAKKLDLPLPDAAEVSNLLTELQSPDTRRRTTAADKLANVYQPLPAKRAEVAKALEGQVLDKDIWLGKAALRGLAMWGGPENITGIIPALDNGFTRGEAIQTLTRYKDDKAAEILAKQLPSQGDRAVVSAALKRMGPMAEKYVIPFVKHKDIWTVKEACNILREIGTAACIPTLTEVANSNAAFTSADARAALQVVQNRR